MDAPTTPKSTKSTLYASKDGKITVLAYEFSTETGEKIPMVEIRKNRLEWNEELKARVEKRSSVSIVALEFANIVNALK